MSVEQASQPSGRSRGFSLGGKSDKSGKSGKVDLTESPSEKRRRDSIWKTSSKANPNAAINDTQPAVAAVLEKSTLEPLRNVQHKDVNGNIITEPDLANPTRPRWERPLDTIRSFEKAIDSGYKRKSIVRNESFDPNNQHNASRASSYQGGYENGGPTPPNGRHSQMSGGYYGGKRPERDGHMDGQNGGPRNRYSGSRMQSESGMRYPSNGSSNHGNGGVYPQHGYHPSHDTVHTGVTNGSDSTGPWANSTDPSSENSSIDKVNAVAKPHPQDPYPGHGNATPFQGPILEEQGPGSYGGAYPQGSAQSGAGMPVQPPAARQPISLGNSSGNATLPSTYHPEPEKKKGWMKRRFSKKE